MTTNRTPASDPMSPGTAAPGATALLEAAVEIADHPFTALVDATTGEVVAGGFCPGDALFARLGPADRGARTPADLEHPVVVALRAYGAGDLDALDGIPVRQSASPFRSEVQAALRRIPAGTALTYRELASAAGRPRAVRAAASGCATNLVALIVPCHRVRRSDGSLGGYAYGNAVKARLLAHEGTT
ncbi:putative methylated-DNA:protein-cysteine methyltransferase [Pseudoclavibacter endophyticus]|uniref:Methylated-DNA--[protein]-cysteine S-methyltransferase n=1 Tax=Pseudoclavibacter endophyticus TaxID=1778590 RepID=A0A6H9WMB2_9MICO|nr:methylated-DNA--[protein]-cysteine S-methyltransferase [Pseudoclavibacter endophyticus]KAB1646890.1 methylated-DNA--[protein]-cysteine S-methyltransferase [Pseudoclavibacter endophyticus]GGA74670.1 putative methylated-DNA:protein-cysteine methyltransferase [Pseudoclavibacter endophyticus]